MENIPLVQTNEKSSTIRSVYLSVNYLRLGIISTTEQSFYGDLEIRARWVPPEEDKEKLRRKTQGLKDGETVEVGSIWTPRLVVMNLTASTLYEEKLTLDRDPAQASKELPPHELPFSPYTPRPGVGVPLSAWKEANDSDQEEKPNVMLTISVSGKFFKNMDLYDFPADTQDLSIVVGSEKLNEVRLFEDPFILSKMVFENFKDKQTWRLYKHIEFVQGIPEPPRYESWHRKLMCLHNGQPVQARPIVESEDTKVNKAKMAIDEFSENLHVINITLHVARRASFYWWNMYLVLACICALCPCAFCIPMFEIKYRLAFILSLLLVFTTFKLSSSDKLPQVQYVTLLDQFTLSLIMLIIGTAFFVSSGSYTLNHVLKESFMGNETLDATVHRVRRGDDAQGVDHKFGFDNKIDVTGFGILTFIFFANLLWHYIRFHIISGDRRKDMLQKTTLFQRRQAMKRSNTGNNSTRTLCLRKGDIECEKEHNIEVNLASDLMF